MKECMRAKINMLPKQTKYKKLSRECEQVANLSYTWLCLNLILNNHLFLIWIYLHLSLEGCHLTPLCKSITAELWVCEEFLEKVFISQLYFTCTQTRLREMFWLWTHFMNAQGRWAEWFTYHSIHCYFEKEKRNTLHNILVTTYKGDIHPKTGNITGHIIIKYC